jgi:hypothetical protein
LAKLTEPRNLVFAVRLTLLGFCLVVAALDPHPRRTVAGALVIVGAAGIAYLPARNPVVRRLLPTVEACIAAIAIVAPPADRSGLLPYLLAPAFAAGLLYGLVPAVIASGFSASVLLTGHLIGRNPSPPTPASGFCSHSLSAFWPRGSVDSPPTPHCQTRTARTNRRTSC